MKLICRNCDLPMIFEEENPKGYLLFKCISNCGVRIGIEIKELASPEQDKIRSLILNEGE